MNRTSGEASGDAATLNQVFQALTDPTRRDIVSRLAIGDATVGELAAPFDVSLQAVSKHITVLEQAGLVTKDKHGQRRLVHLEAETLGLMTAWIERHQRQAEERFTRLDTLLAQLPHDDSAPSEHPE